MEKINEMDKMVLSTYGKVRVFWYDRPENYSKESKIKIRNHFANKYGILKNNINVVYQPVRLNKNGELIVIADAKIENIMDINYQRALMKECLVRDNKTIDFDRIIALDDKVNSDINVDQSVSQHKSWSIKWLMLDNFLSFGQENYVSFSKLKGLTVVNSIPSNQGGKTTLTIDAIKFLLHGTTTKTDKNEEIFNTFSNKNELIVKGMLDIDGEEIIIERKMNRTAKKTGGWTVVNKLKYYELLPDGSEKEQNEEDAKRTTLKIKETIGTEKDFEMLVLANEKNLDDMIGLTTGESGKFLSRLIGLEILQLKEASVRTMYNDFNKKRKSNDYDVITLNNEILEHEEKIKTNNELELLLKTRLDETKANLENLNKENDRLLNSKEKIDVTISTLNPSKLQVEIDTLTNNGKSLKARINELNEKIKSIGDILFDEDLHYTLTRDVSALNTQKAVAEAEIKRLGLVIKGLIDGGICQSCNRKLDNVDNTEHINKHQETLNQLTEQLNKTISDISDKVAKLDGLNKIKSEVDTKNRLELDRDRLEVEIGSLRNQVGVKMNDLKKYNLNLTAIEHNKNVEINVSKVKTDIIVNEKLKEETITKIERVNSDIKHNKESILNKEKIIETLKKEEEIDKVFKVYIDLVGKKGISKLVLRSILPIINSEVQRLLDDVCDFEIEIFIDEKNDVEFLIRKDDVLKQLKSASGFERTAASLALRATLGKMSTLPMPNFITFDEVLGKVAKDNLDNIKLLFDKIKEMYDVVFLITFNDLVLDWSENIITVEKINNISKVSVI